MAFWLGWADPVAFEIWGGWVLKRRLPVTRPDGNWGQRSATSAGTRLVRWTRPSTLAGAEWGVLILGVNKGVCNGQRCAGAFRLDCDGPGP